MRIHWLLATLALPGITLAAEGMWTLDNLPAKRMQAEYGFTPDGDWVKHVMLGSARIAGEDLANNPIAAKRQLAFFSDEPRLFEYLTVWQHLVFTARIYQVVDYQEIGRHLLVELEMAEKVDLLPGELSRGMKQKLAIACGLLHSPKVIFFDEPLTGLDPLGIRRMKDSILNRAREGAAIIISSHLLHLLEEVCSHVLILKGGRKILDGTMDEILQKSTEHAGDANLEEVFFRATGEAKENA